MSATLKDQILSLASDYTALAHRQFLPGDAAGRDMGFEPGKTVVPYSGRCFDADEMVAAVRCTLDFWLTLGAEGAAFEKEFADYLGVSSSLLVNSGSSANLLAIACLTSHTLGGARLKPGDEVITAAAGFPTTVAPILQHGLVPVFVDSDPITLNPRMAELEKAVSPRTRAVFFAHTLGNPFDVESVAHFCRTHSLFLIEDNCDALGSTYGGELTGTFGSLSTESFYPPHHITMGEGGVVNFKGISSAILRRAAESFRDWGRDCWCASGADNTCHKRYGWKLGDLPLGYDHKHTFSHLGYNLKPLDIAAAIGRAQLKKLPAFTAARRRNWQFLRRELADLETYFDFMLPTHATDWNAVDGSFTWDASGNTSDPSWFGFMLLRKPDAPFTRRDFAEYLETAKIGNRMLFGGNLVRQPAFTQLKREHPAAFRVVDGLSGADRIMNDALFVGVYPGLTQPMLEYIATTVRAFAGKY